MLLAFHRQLLPRVRAFSTAHVARATPPDLSATRDAQQLIAEADADADPSPSATISRNRGIRENIPLRPFPNHSLIRPHQLSRESRTRKEPPKPRPPRVGPSVKEAHATDAFHRLQLDPVDFASTPSVLNSFLTEMGKIKPRYQTWLSRKSQRRLGKAVRRSRMMGIIPAFTTRGRSMQRLNPAYSIDDSQ